MTRKLRFQRVILHCFRSKLGTKLRKTTTFARVLVNGQAIAGNITSMDDPYNTGLVPATGGESDGWIDAEFDVSQWAGQEVAFNGVHH